MRNMLLLILLTLLIFTGSCGMSPITNNNTPEESGSEGSYSTGVYPSAASLSGASYTQTQADAKCSEAWQYFKTELLSDSGAVVRPEDNMVVSEGQSYGMMLAVQNDDQATFDKIWLWTKTYMQSGNSLGLFAWKCEPDGDVVDSETAPDADEMIALALFFASRRWGDKSEPYDYSTQAKAICTRILDQAVTSDHFLVFSTENKTWFDPSYQMPAFYRLFAEYTGESRWSNVASSAYTLINNCLKSSYGNTENGLVPDYCNKDGSLRSSGKYFYYDAMRTPFFFGLDSVWFGNSEGCAYVDKIIGSFFGPQYSSFGDKYDLDGSKLSSNHVVSWIGSFCGAAMGGTSNSDKVNFFNHLMSQDWPTGTYRYYDICWMNFGLLLSSGNFRIY